MTKLVALFTIALIQTAYTKVPCSVGDSVPEHPVAVTPVFPMRHYAEGKANLTQFNFIKEYIFMSWYYDYPGNRMLEMWSTDHSVGYPYPNATAVFDGHKGEYDIYIHEFKTCIKFEFGMGIARPDSFVPALTNGTLLGRECHLGYWADRYTVPIGGDYGDFDAWFHIDSTFPLEFRGVTIPTVLAEFEHTNTVPIFKYGSVDKTSQEISPVDDQFFPDFIGSLDGLDKLFSDFENLKGKCHTIPMLMEHNSDMADEKIQSLMESFDQAKENLSGQNQWAKYNILKGHAIEMANHVQNKNAKAQDSVNDTEYFLKGSKSQDDSKNGHSYIFEKAKELSLMTE